MNFLLPTLLTSAVLIKCKLSSFLENFWLSGVLENKRIKVLPLNVHVFHLFTIERMNNSVDLYTISLVCDSETLDISF